MKVRHKPEVSGQRVGNQEENQKSGRNLDGRIDLLLAGGLAVFSFLIYTQTMSRSIPFIDGGELTTVLWTLGIAHPTGYPLFSLIGHLFVHIPFSSEVSVRANLFAAVCTSLASGAFFLVFERAMRLLAFVTSVPVKKGKSPGANRNLVGGAGQIRISEMRASAAAGVLILVFSSTFWDQSTSVEVYPLQLLLFGLIMLSWLSLYERPTRSRAAVAGLCLGLGFTNHMTTILTLPALIFLAASSYRKTKFDKRLIFWGMIGGLVASLLYLYLPIRASQDPLMDWDNPHNLKRFIWHVTGKQFSTWMFSSFEVFQHQLGVFFNSLYTEFRISLVVIILGLIRSFLSHRKYFWWCLLLIVGDLAYAANYSIHDISSYFLLSYISLAMLGAIGISFLLERARRLPASKLIATGMIALFPAVSAFANFNKVNESDDYCVENYVRDILTSLPRNSVVLSFQWDDFVSGSIYYQHVDGLRPDITIIDKELLRRSWYAAQVHTRFDFLFPKDDPIYTAYQESLRLFENDLPYDPNSIENTYSDFIREIISGAMRDGREVFVGPEIEDKYLYGYQKVPYGLLFELTTDTSYIAYGPRDLNGFHASERVSGDYSRQILGFYTQMFLARAQYEYSHNHLNKTLYWLDKALEVEPSLQTAQIARAEVIRKLRQE